MKKVLIALLVIFQFQHTFAQKKVTVTLEDVKQECKDLPLDKRVRITVARFSATTPVPGELGANLAAMLTNALQDVNCFRVLETLNNASDMNNEINYGESAYAKKSAAPKKGKQLGAQVVVTGEITEFSTKKSGFGVAVVSVGSNKVKIGMIIKMVNPETRDVLFSKSINVEGKAGSGMALGAFGANLVSSGSMDPAVANAAEQGIIQGVEFLASKKDQLQLPDAGAGTSASSTNETVVTLSGANFSSFNAMAGILSSISTYKSMDKSLSAGVGTFTVTHTGPDDAFLDELNKKIGSKYEVTGFAAGSIDLKAH